VRVKILSRGPSFLKSLETLKTPSRPREGTIVSRVSRVLRIESGGRDRFGQLLPAFDDPGLAGG
jgi:hypothetical protein